MSLYGHRKGPKNHQILNHWTWKFFFSALLKSYLQVLELDQILSQLQRSAKRERKKENCLFIYTFL